MKGLSGRLFVALQYAIPRYWMTRLVYRLARVRSAWFKNFVIRRFVSLYGVDVSEATAAVPDGYPNFNAFFTRELRENARPVADSADAIVSPVDGTLSAFGTITDGQIFQAKGKTYALEDLLAIDLEDAGRLAGGRFATIYLAPHNYHRVHAPFAGRITALRYVPGELFSVNTATVLHLPRLFVRNERLMLRLETAVGPAFVILVGALNVGSITTPWTGEIRPSRTGMVETFAPRTDAPLDVDRGGLLGWFNLGSTVIVLLPAGTARWATGCRAGQSVRMGEAIGQLRDPA